MQGAVRRVLNMVFVALRRIQVAKQRYRALEVQRKFRALRARKLIYHRKHDLIDVRLRKPTNIPCATLKANKIVKLLYEQIFPHSRGSTD